MSATANVVATLLLVALTLVARPALADDDVEGSPSTTRLLSLTYDGFDVDVYVSGTSGSAWGTPTDDARKILLGPICAFQWDAAGGHLRYTRRTGPAGTVFFDIPIVLRAAGVQQKAAEEIRRVKGWDVDPAEVMWMDLTAIVATPDHAQLFGHGIRAEVSHGGGVVHTRPVDVVSFVLRAGEADAFEKALIAGHNFTFEYEAHFHDPARSRIEIRTSDVMDMEFTRNLKGPGGATYVTRNQALELMRRMENNLKIKVELDPRVPADIRDRMIEKAFENLKDHFWDERQVPQREFSMEELSKFIVDPSGSDFKADVMKHMAEEFHNKDENYLLDKYRSDLKNLLHTKGESDYRGASSGSFSFFKLFGGGGSLSGSSNRKTERSSEEDRLLDLVREIKSNVENSFQFEKEGEFYVAKAVTLMDVESLKRDDGVLLSEEVVVRGGGFRSDPYRRNTRESIWRPSVDDLLQDDRLKPFLGH
jgi:hypothetical protein